MKFEINSNSFKSTHVTGAAQNLCNVLGPSRVIMMTGDGMRLWLDWEKANFQGLSERDTLEGLFLLINDEWLMIILWKDEMCDWWSWR